MTHNVTLVSGIQHRFPIIAMPHQGACLSSFTDKFKTEANKRSKKITILLSQKRKFKFLSTIKWMPFFKVHSIELIIMNALVLQNRVRIKSAHYLMHIRKKKVFHVLWSLISSLYILSILPSEIHLFSAFGSDWSASAFPLCYVTHVKQIPRHWRLEMLVPQILPIDAITRVFHVGDDSHRNR